MRVKVKVLGVPAVPPRELDVEFEGRTLAALRDRVGRDFGEITTMDGLLLAFVNGKATRRAWDKEVLSDGDRVLLALPISGG